MGNYKFYIDLSGSVNKDDLHIGIILFNESFRFSFLDQFYAQFPSLKHFKNKSSEINIEKLKKVIEFMNNKKIKMTCVKFHKGNFKKTRLQILEEIKKLTSKKDIILNNYPEKILGILYYNAIISMIGKKYKKYPYNIETCIESQINIQHSLSAIMLLASRDRYHLQLNPNFRRIQHMLKFADFVAGAGKKIDKFILDKFDNFNFINMTINERDYKKVFHIKKKEYEIQLRIRDIVKFNKKKTKDI